MSDEVKLKLGEKELMVSMSDLPKHLRNLTRIMSATVSVARGFTARDYGDGKEEYFDSKNVDLSLIWEAIGKEALLDDKSVEEVRNIVTDIITEAVAKAQLTAYRNTLMAVYERANALKLRKLDGITTEVKLFQEPGGFDPMMIFSKDKE